MKPEVYDKVRRQVSPALREVNVSGWGEPFLAPVFYQMLDDLLPAGKRVQVVTNGTIIRRDCLERLIRTPSLICVSMDGTTADVLEHIRAGADFERILEFLATVQEIRARCGHPQFTFQISWTITRSNVSQLTECVDLAHSYGVQEIVLQNFNRWGRTDEYARRESLYHLPEEVLPHWQRAHQRGQDLGIRVGALIFEPDGPANDKTLQRPPHLYDGDRLRQCPLPWWCVYIDVDGSVSPCCVYPPVGNLLKQSFREIWNGPALRDLRRTVNTPNMPKACRDCCLLVRL